MRRLVAIAPGKDTHVQVASGHIGKALVHRTLIRGDIILHGDHIMPHLPKRVVYGLAIILEVIVGGRNIDFCHRNGSRP